MIPGITASRRRGGGGSTWTPADIATQCWLDADDSGTVTTVSSAVSAWADKSGNSRDVSQATSGSRPGLIAAGRAGKDVIRFDGWDDSLVWGAGFAQASGQNVFLAGDLTAIGTNYREILGRNPATVSTPAVYVGNGSVSYRPCVFWNNAARATWGANVNRPGIFRWSLIAGSPGSATTQVDGHTEKTAAVTSSTFADWAAIANPDVQQAAFDAFELIITGSVDTTTRQKIEGYLAHKWGLASNLPSGHPYKSAPPTV